MVIISNRSLKLSKDTCVLKQGLRYLKIGHYNRISHCHQWSPIALNLFSHCYELRTHTQMYWQMVSDFLMMISWVTAKCNSKGFGLFLNTTLKHSRHRVSNGALKAQCKIYLSLITLPMLLENILYIADPVCLW